MALVSQPTSYRTPGSALPERTSPAPRTEPAWDSPSSAQSSKRTVDKRTLRMRRAAAPMSGSPYRARLWAPIPRSPRGQPAPPVQPPRRAYRQHLESVRHADGVIAAQRMVALAMTGYVHTVCAARTFGVEHLRVEPGTIIAPNHRSDNDVPLLVSALYPPWSKAAASG